MANSNTKAKPQAKEESATEKAELKTPITAKEIDPNQYVVVRNGFQGKLIYKSARTGEKFVWDEFGSEQEIQLRELRNAKNTSKKFFESNWFIFDEDWIIDYLGVRQFYKNVIRIEDFDKVFSKTPAEIKKIIGGMNSAQKRSVAYRAVELIAAEEIDSRKTISALEEALGTKLIEE